MCHESALSECHLGEGRLITGAFSMILGIVDFHESRQRMAAIQGVSSCFVLGYTLLCNTKPRLVEQGPNAKVRAEA